MVWNWQNSSQISIAYTWLLVNIVNTSDEITCTRNEIWWANSSGGWTERYDTFSGGLDYYNTPYWHEEYYNNTFYKIGGYAYSFFRALNQGGFCSYPEAMPNGAGADIYMSSGGSITDWEYDP